MAPPKAKEAKPAKTPKIPKEQVAAGIFPKRALGPDEFNAGGMTFNKTLLKRPEFVEKLVKQQRDALETTNPDTLIRSNNGPWNGEGIEGGRPLTPQEKDQAALWIGNSEEAVGWLERHPGFWDTFDKYLPGFASSIPKLFGANKAEIQKRAAPLEKELPLHLREKVLKGPEPNLLQKIKDATFTPGVIANAAGALTGAAAAGNKLEAGDAGELNDPYITKHVDKFDPQQQAAIKDLLSDAIAANKELIAQGRQPMPLQNKIPWQAIAQAAQAPLDYYANSAALKQRYQNEQIPGLTANLEGLGAPPRSSTYQNALQQAQNNYNEQLWGLRSKAASQALGALGSLGTHFGNVESERQKRFAQLEGLSNRGLTHGLTQLQEHQHLPATVTPQEPTTAQTVSGIAKEWAPTVAQLASKFLLG